MFGLKKKSNVLKNAIDEDKLRSYEKHLDNNLNVSSISLEVLRINKKPFEEQECADAEYYYAFDLDKTDCKQNQYNLFLSISREAGKDALGIAQSSIKFDYGTAKTINRDNILTDEVMYYKVTKFINTVKDILEWHFEPFESKYENETIVYDKGQLVELNFAKGKRLDADDLNLAMSNGTCMVTSSDGVTSVNGFYIAKKDDEKEERCMFNVKGYANYKTANPILNSQNNLIGYEYSEILKRLVIRLKDSVKDLIS